MGAGLSASALFAKHGVRIFAARKEPIIGAENERLCRPKWDAKDSVKTRADRRIGQVTLAAALALRGYRLITDDICAITLPLGGAPIVHPDGRQLKLWGRAIERLELDAIRGKPVRGCLEKFYVEPREATTEALPLGAVYALGEARHFGGSGIERPNVVDCALLLRSHAYRPLLVARLQQKDRFFTRVRTSPINLEFFS